MAEDSIWVKVTASTKEFAEAMRRTSIAMRRFSWSMARWRRKRYPHGTRARQFVKLEKLRKEAG
jgi:hypothetical protein